MPAAAGAAVPASAGVGAGLGAGASTGGAALMNPFMQKLLLQGLGMGMKGMMGGGGAPPPSPGKPMQNFGHF
jgi:hypothetical protein